MVRFVSVLLVSATLAVGVGQETIDLYNGSDTNISDWYSNVVIPQFQAATPECRVNQVITGGRAATTQL